MIALGRNNLQDLFLGEREVSKVMKGNDLVWRKRRPKNIRYIRETLRGSERNNFNHWVEIQAISGGNNVALNKVPTLVRGRQNGSTRINVITDGSTDTRSYFDGGEPTATILIDLGRVYPIDELRVWHYYHDNRSYISHLEVSENNQSWETIYNSGNSRGYSETSQGKIYEF